MSYAPIAALLRLTSYEQAAMSARLPGSGAAAEELELKVGKELIIALLTPLPWGVYNPGPYIYVHDADWRKSWN